MRASVERAYTNTRRVMRSPLPAVGSEQHILQSVGGAVGRGDEAEEEEDEVG